MRIVASPPDFRGQRHLGTVEPLVSRPALCRPKTWRAHELSSASLP